MELIPKSLINRIPRIGETDSEEDPKAWVKLFFPDFTWSWYVIEYDGSDVCFGWVDGDFPELGYFSLAELKDSWGIYGLPIERDRYFRPCRLSKLRGA